MGAAAKIKDAAKDVTKMKPRELAEELVRLFAQHGPMLDRAAELKSALKDGATTNFKETFAGIGEVSVSAARAKEKTGTAPEVIVDAFLALPKKEQNALVKAGVVQIVDVYREAYYGAVRVKVF